MTIYSYDIAPSPEAYERLRHTGVQIIAKPSVEGARGWRRAGGRPIDLLFIDGSHALQDVFGDFNAWMPFVRPGGEVVFHDYDSVERGGLAHLGSYVLLRTILRRGILDDPVHTDRLLRGAVGRPDRARVTAHECHQTFANLGSDVVRARDRDYAGWALVGEAPLARLIGCCLQTDGMRGLLSPEQATPPGKFLVFSRPLQPALEALAGRGIAGAQRVVVDNLQLCYLVAHALQRRRDALLSLASSRSEFFRWEEVLFMFEHAFGPSRFPDRIAAPAKADVAKLSVLVAREQVRLTALARLHEALVGDRL